MQSRVLKFLAILGLTLFFGAGSLHAQVGRFRLQQADSLYGKKKYTQSLDHYASILSQHEYSPAMLLKMAYIEEGLNRIGPALYYLNLYYLASNDKQVLDKMEELATKYNLKGYDHTDADRFLTFYHDYYLPLSIALAALALLLLSITFALRRRGRSPIAVGIVSMLILLVLVVHINLGEKPSTGIVGNANTYLMDGPSPGAAVISVIDEGHRVEIVGHRDVWVQVMWNGATAYIKENNLLSVSL